MIGRKGSGKSEILEVLIVLLKEKGHRVGVIKHLASDDIEIDQPEKDTFRYRQSGAETVMLAGRKRLAVFSNLPAEIPVEELLLRFEGCDLVFLEGFFSNSVPKIEVWRQSLGKPLSGGMENIFALCSEDPIEINVPHFSSHELPSLADFIEKKLIKRHSEPRPSARAVQNTRGEESREILPLRYAQGQDDGSVYA